MLQTDRGGGLTNSFDLVFKCQYKEVEEKYLHKKQADSVASCLYNEPDETSISETLEDDDILFLCEEVYREDILTFFKLENYDDDTVNKKTEKLFKACSRGVLFASLIAKIKMHVGELEDEECAFMQLFSYPFFNLTHECIKQYLMKGTVDPELSATIEEAVVTFFKPSHI
jgi:hypothetical protein